MLQGVGLRIVQPITGKMPAAKRALVIVVSLAAAVFAGLMIAFQRYSLLALCPLVYLAVQILVRPRVAITLFYISVFIPFSYLQRYFVSLPVALLWLPHVLLLVSVISALLDSKRSNRAVLMPRSLLWVGALWMGSSLISLIYNNSSPVAALLSFRGLFLIYGSVLLHRLYFNFIEQERLIRKLTRVGLFMFPVTLFQRVYLVERMQLGSGDMVTGLFSVYGDLVFFQIFCLFAVISWWLHGRRLVSLSPVLVVTFLFATLVISNSKAAPLYFLLCAMFLFWQCRTQLSWRLFGALLIVVIVGIVGAVAFDEIWQRSYERTDSVIENFYNPSAIHEYLLSDRGTASGGLQRGAAVVFNYELIGEKPLTFLIGLGPGSLSDSKVPGGTGYIYARYPKLALNNNHLSTIVGENGVAGVLLVVLLLLGLYRDHHANEPDCMVVLRRCVIFLVTALMLYMPVFLSPLIALVVGVVTSCPQCEPAGRVQEKALISG